MSSPEPGTQPSQKCSLDKKRAYGLSPLGPFLRGLIPGSDSLWPWAWPPISYPSLHSSGQLCHSLLSTLKPGHTSSGNAGATAVCQQDTASVPLPGQALSDFPLPCPQCQGTAEAQRQEAPRPVPSRVWAPPRGMFTALRKATPRLFWKVNVHLGSLAVYCQWLSGSRLSVRQKLR